MKFLLVLVILFCHTCYSQAKRYDVVIDEIMADPSPPALTGNGLPDAEYLEIRNISGKTFDLNGWKLADASGAATVTIRFMLRPDSIVILCSNTIAPSFTPFGTVIGLGSFPSLDNDGEVLVLKSREGNVVFAVEYTSRWYRNPVKAQGGWSLEMTDIGNYCSGFSNWNASVDAKGGTPGKKNSAMQANPDLEPPALVHSFAEDSLTLIVVFNEPLDSASAVAISGYQLRGSDLGIISVSLLEPLFSSVRLHLSAALRPDSRFRLAVIGIRDCSGNTIKSRNTVMTGRSVPLDTQRIVINEVLFNPRSPGVDYVELFNYSKSVINLIDLFIANRSNAGVVGSVRALSTTTRLLFPGDYCLITEDAEMVTRQFVVSDTAIWIELPTVPSFPDDQGTVVLLNARGKVIDELNYDEKWHFQLIADRQGIALERINPGKPAQDKENWHSASGTRGYGTPGYLNSQLRLDEGRNGTIIVEPKVISPDNDGLDDFLTIRYQFPEPGFVCTISIYDAGGNLVKTIASNMLCGLEGYLRWDGIDRRNRKSAMGVYLVLTETYTLKGEIRRFKNSVVVAAKFR